MADFGRDVGKAFQIRDDIQGIWGSPSTTGKEAVKDLRNRKKTLPVLMAMARATEEQKGELQSFYDGTSHDVDGVLRVLQETGVKEIAQRQANRLLAAAMARLERAEIMPQARREFSALAAELVGQDDRRSAGTVTKV
jgi:geranylgeranyl diphosphate synthase type I